MRGLIELDQLETFLAVLENGSFSRAAEAMRIGQSTVSFHVKALETAVGARLLDRRGGGVKLTAPGKILEHYAKRIIELREEALLRTRSEESGELGRVTIGASTIPGEYLLPPVLAELRKKHPKIAVRVDISDSKRAQTALLAEECDFALVGSKLSDKRLATTAFAEDSIVLVGPKGSDLVNGDKLAPKDLARVPLVLREEGSGTRDAIRAVLAKHGPEAGDMKSAAAPILVGSTEAAKRCVVCGLGVTFISERAIADEVESGALRVLSFPGTPIRRTFYIARLKSVTASTPARQLIQLLARTYR